MSFFSTTGLKPQGRETRLTTGARSPEACGGFKAVIAAEVRRLKPQGSKGLPPRPCAGCGKPIHECMGFVKIGDWLEGRYPYRELCGFCVEKWQWTDEGELAFQPAAAPTVGPSAAPGVEER